MRKRLFGWTAVLMWFVCIFVIHPGSYPAYAQFERIQPPASKVIDVWRITHDPTVRDWANYHNTQCWSPEGRYLCFTHFAADGKEFGLPRAAEVHLFDFLKQKDICVDNGIHPRWAHNHNWLQYSRVSTNTEKQRDLDAEVVWLDVTTGKRQRIAHGVSELRNISCDDRWLYGLLRDNSGRRTKAVRIGIETDSKQETLQSRSGCEYDWFMANPAHPKIMLRDNSFKDDYFFRANQNIPFPARHYLDCDLNGSNWTTPKPVMEGSHFSWSGDGEYFLCGNGQMRGRKWDEPFPSNIQFLAAINCGDICSCGRSGRWICGSSSSGRGKLLMADLRSGDGWEVVDPHSVVCYPGSEDNSGPYDIDAKGSPDATKIAFISNYDLAEGPSTTIAEAFENDVLMVQSTAGFSDQGRLVVVDGFRREVFSYAKRTENSFEGLVRGLYGTAPARFRPGQAVTSFESRLLSQEQRKDLPLQSRKRREIIQDANSPLMCQRSSDIYVAVVRLPDQPLLRLVGEKIELIPGENHWETQGYHVFRDSERVTEQLLRPRETFELSEIGNYTAIAVEWSGLESKPSLPLSIDREITLSVLSETPGDFFWTSDRWLTGGAEVSEKDAMQAEEVTKEIVHIYDGVIHRGNWQHGQRLARDDLNREGQTSRRLIYRAGKLARREYYDRDRTHFSTEFFDTDGFVSKTEQYVLYNKAHKYKRTWWYEQAEPVKCVYETPSLVTTYIRNNEGTWSVR